MKNQRLNGACRVLSHKSASGAHTEQSNSLAASGTIPAPVAHPGAPEGLAVGLLRRPGRPKGSKNRSTIDARQFYGKHARKLVPRLVKRAIQEIEKPAGNLDFAERVGKLAAAYAWGRPVESKEISGPDGRPIQTEDLVPAEAHQRLAALFLQFRQQGPALSVVNGHDADAD